MRGDSVATLYDALHALESRWQKDAAYPIHKQLRFGDSAPADIYDWISDRIDLPDHGAILDAGCGVGFGTFRLAQRSTCRVTGISVSSEEITAARRAATSHALSHRVEFQRASFDDLPFAAYDVIVAVESLKHSRDLRITLRSMLAALKPEGQLVVVEDVVTGHGYHAIADTIVKDWALTRLFTEIDYRATLGPVTYKVVDLTAAVPRSGKLNVAAKLKVLESLLPFARGRLETALRAFRSGLCLQQLYADGAIAYKALFCRVAPRTSR